MKARKLTENSFILTSDLGNNVALVFKRDESFISSHDTTQIFLSLEQIAQCFNEKLIFEEVEEKAIEKILFDYPIKHDFFIEENEKPFPSYKIKNDSKVVYAAGWWVIPHESGYRLALSPKVLTINNKCYGPYKTKFLANAQMNYVLKNTEN